MKKTAEFSPCRKYRYALWRVWDESLPVCMFIGLNPSTADEVEDDPTIRRCINFAKSWGYGSLVMANLFAFRATDPKVMKAEPFPVGANNDYYLEELASKSSMIVAAWGNHGAHLKRADQVKALLPNLHCLKVTGTGQPSHPLYLKADLQPITFNQMDFFK